MTSKHLIGVIAGLGFCVGASVVVFHWMHGSAVESRHLAFAALQLALAGALWSHAPSVRWIALVLWSIQGILGLVSVAVTSGRFGAGSTVVSILWSSACIIAALLLLSKPAQSWFVARKA